MKFNSRKAIREVNLTKLLDLEKDNPDEPDAIVQVRAIEWLPTQFTLNLEADFRALQDNDDASSVHHTILEKLSELVISWNFIDENGEPLPQIQEALADDEKFKRLVSAVPMIVFQTLLQEAGTTNDIPQKSRR